jgi:hypothetical protein
MPVVFNEFLIEILFFVILLITFLSSKSIGYVSAPSDPNTVFSFENSSTLGGALVAKSKILDLMVGIVLLKVTYVLPENSRVAFLNGINKSMS